MKTNAIPVELRRIPPPKQPEKYLVMTEEMLKAIKMFIFEDINQTNKFTINRSNNKKKTHFIFKMVDVIIPSNNGMS